MGNWKIFFVIPFSSFIICFINTAVTTYNPMRIIFGIYPHCMIVNVFIFFIYIFKSFPSIVCNSHVSVHYINYIHIDWVSKNFLIIISTRYFAALFLPGFASVCGFIKTTFSLRCLNNCIDNLRICIRNIHTNSTYLNTWQSFVYFSPSISSIYRFMNTRSRSTTNICINVSSSLMTCSI